ncbi:photosystem I P700 chlorophyll a apoprotein A2 [Iris pallida]|uniref:Photosystem I P700 chlorophyll a apoprotein A2 (Plastid) n=1 Tax=Iris pallida TaxID=29817 RepID=A0AAX6F659_IRIPA|nr:photosystem I P700 chlorophyll a apoprotein A2 [Iris pallida]
MSGQLLKIRVHRSHMKSYHTRIVSIRKIWVRSRFVFSEYQKRA